ncbi:hypothetical protein VOLCADRAFT_106690 [Volvox carteri f. nagariensis]|uniref:HD/PDEase domain-containing protein n=1 Tax=Volvox carteri f. nagariensis TaxID=3068 RepID=D8U940_VOLCA|nr:uncharacterized protein VOLCADRAFT_106690 [Volvox carteri f. nagariensis]EFJ43683.1 hypothetical protein VOLCADRAFT_106690 [Volvox carteri f. nagariensis]|eukprot:XP_002955164.1 hypothetical protein VOLCADRAFT_106690 [Volvox carteri f. nagariensis]
MDDDQDAVVFSQEAMRQHEDLIFPSYNFGSEPQHTQHARQGGYPTGNSPFDAVGVASGCGADFMAVAAGSRRPKATARSATGRREPKGKVFSDPVHGTFRLDPINVAIIDTPQFQRLRDLHQLGLTHLVFPGAIHTRFEHSLGTSFKAFEVADRIYRTQGRELGMELDDVRLVSLAGLCHDLGHGPFSHVFEYEFLRRKRLGVEPYSEEDIRLKEWHHEIMSTRILEYLVDENNIEGIEQEDIRRISDFIKGDAHEDRGYLFDIVNNKRCGVDVDKVDYLQRDAMMCDVNIGCDFKRLLTLTKVLQNQIAYKWSEYSNIWDLFHARESMHRKVYTHRHVPEREGAPLGRNPEVRHRTRAKGRVPVCMKTKAVEFMVVDALLEADQALRFSDNIDTAEDFCMLNDSLLNTIENFNVHRRLAPPLETDAETCLAKAQALIRRLRCRDLYRYGNQFVVPYEYLEDSRWKDMSREFTAEEVVSAYRGGDVALRPNDVIVSQTKIDFTQGGRNPVDNVLFFDNSDDETGHHAHPYQVVGILPRYHQEVLLRVYTPHSDTRYQTAVSSALEAWCRKRFGSKVQMATPARGRQQPASSMAREVAFRDADPRRVTALRLPEPGSAANVNTFVAAASILNSVTLDNGGGDGGFVVDKCRLPNGRPATSAAGPSRAGGVDTVISMAAGVEADVSAGRDDVNGDGGGTPTRSTPYSSARMARVVDPEALLVRM